MKKEVEKNLRTIMPGNDELDQFFQILDLPDEKFDEIYPKMREVSMAAFTSSEFQSEVLRNAKVYAQTNDVDIEAEKEAIQELLDEIRQDDSLSANKREFLIDILNASAMTTYELLQVPRERIEVKIQLIDGGVAPRYAHPTDAGADIFANEDVTIEPGETKVVHTGIKVAIPIGYEIQIRPRSGLSLKTNLRVANAPGTIDTDYRGEVGVIMTNIGNEPETIAKSDKIAQMVISEVPMIKWIEVDALDETERGEGGFGSTGKR